MEVDPPSVSGHRSGPPPRSGHRSGPPSGSGHGSGPPSLEVVTEVDPPQKWSWKWTPLEVVTEEDSPGSGHGGGPPLEVVMEVDQATCKVFTISICRLNLVYVCF